MMKKALTFFAIRMNRVLANRKLVPFSLPRISSRSLLHNPEVDEEGNRLKQKLKQVNHGF